MTTIDPKKGWTTYHTFKQGKLPKPGELWYVKTERDTTSPTYYMIISCSLFTRIQSWEDKLYQDCFLITLLWSMPTFGPQIATFEYGRDEWDGWLLKKEM